jgi:hypothetical protein
MQHQSEPVVSSQFGQHSTKSFQTTPHTYEPTPIVGNTPVSAAEAQKLMRSKVHRPLTPLDTRASEDTHFINHKVLHDSPVTKEHNYLRQKQRQRTQSPKSNHNSSIDTSVIPPKIARDPRRKTAWLKARAQYTRDRHIQQQTESDLADVMDLSPEPFHRVGTGVFGLKRKQSAFVKEEELKYVREDHAGTPHISELQIGDEVVAPLSVEELGMGGEVDALARF